MLLVCYMNKQAGAEFSQAYLANYELCWIFTFVLGLIQSQSKHQMNVGLANKESKDSCF